MDDEGWVDIGELIIKSKPRLELSREFIVQIVKQNNKQRFALSEDGERIRANQGHSIDVDVGLAPSSPPETLFHGTAIRFVASIKDQGLTKRRRQHVHLSPDRDTAIAVGKRHGEPTVLEINAGAMHRAGSVFYLSANGVWLVDAVPVQFIVFPPSAVGS